MNDTDKSLAVMKAVALTSIFKSLGWRSDHTTILALRLLVRISEIRGESLTDEQLWQEIEFLVVDNG